MNLVIVEGGPKALKKYKSLMLHRIKWNQTRKKGGAPVVDGRYTLLYSGTSEQRTCWVQPFVLCRDVVCFSEV